MAADGEQTLQRLLRSAHSQTSRKNHGLRDVNLFTKISFPPRQVAQISHATFGVLGVILLLICLLVPINSVCMPDQSQGSQSLSLCPRGLCPCPPLASPLLCLPPLPTSPNIFIQLNSPPKSPSCILCASDVVFSVSTLRP